MNNNHARRNADHVDIIVSVRNARADWFNAVLGSITSSVGSRHRARPNPLIMQGLHIS